MSSELKQAIEHHQAGRLRAAARLYTRLLRKDANHADALHLLGVIHLQSGRPREAVRLIRNAIGRNLKEPKYFANLGEAYRALGQLDDAIGCGLHALKLNPDLVEVRVNLGVAYFMQQRYAEASEQFAHAVRRQPGNALHNCRFGDALRAQGRLAEAESRYRYALQINPNFARAHCQLGSLLFLADEPHKAEIHCRKAVELQPNNIENLLHLSRCLHRLGQVAESKATCTKAMEFKPKTAHTYDLAGETYRDFGDNQNATECYKAALNIGANYLPAKCHLAAIEKEPAVAVEKLKTILQEHPNFVEARNELEKLGKLDSSTSEQEPAQPFFHVHRASGDEWPAIAETDAARIWTGYQELDLTQWSSAPEIERHQLQQARRLLIHCYHHVPHYRELWKKHDIRPWTIDSMEAFRNIPLLQRYDFQLAGDKTRAMCLPDGMHDVAELSTSGTTGIPVTIRQTNVVGFWYRAFFLRDLQWCGIDPRGSFAAIRTMGKTEEQRRRFMNGQRYPFWSKPLDKIIETGPSYVMDIHQSIDKQLDWLLSFQPENLLTYPSNLQMLGEVLKEQNERLYRLRTIQTIAEQMSPETQAALESTFGVPVHNTYSCNEAGYLATPCPDGHGYHVHAENVLFEVLDDQGEPCKPGETGRIVLTTLHNFITPMVRYEINDQAVVGENPCPCGRGLPLLKRILGKVRPFFKLPDGTKRNSVDLLVGIRAIGGYAQHQLIQHTPDRMTIRLVPSKDWTAENEEKIRAKALDFCGEDVTVDLDLVDRIQLPDGGKLRDVVVEF